jgi:hypothetical protein
LNNEILIPEEYLILSGETVLSGGIANKENFPLASLISQNGSRKGK